MVSQLVCGLIGKLILRLSREILIHGCRSSKMELVQNEIRSVRVIILKAWHFISMKGRFLATASR